MANTFSTNLQSFNDSVKGLGQKTVIYDYLTLQNPTVQTAIEKVQQALSSGKDPNTDSATKNYLKQIPTGLIQDLYKTVSLNPYDKSSSNNLPSNPLDKNVLSKVFGSNSNYGNYAYNVFGPAAQNLSLSATKYQPKDANKLYKPFQQALAGVYGSDTPDYSKLSSFLGINSTDRPLSGIQPNAASNPFLNTVYNERLTTFAKGGTGYDQNVGYGMANAYGTGYNDNLVHTYDSAAAAAVKEATLKKQYDWLPVADKAQVVKALEPGQFVGKSDTPAPKAVPIDLSKTSIADQAALAATLPKSTPKAPQGQTPDISKALDNTPGPTVNSQGLEQVAKNALQMTVNGPDVTWKASSNVPTPLEVLYPTYQYTPSYAITLKGNGVFGKDGTVLKPAAPSQTFIDQVNADLKASAQTLADTFNQVYGGQAIGGVSTTTKKTTLNFGSSGGAPATYNNATLISKTDPAPIAVYTITPDAKVINNNPFYSTPKQSQKAIDDTLAKNTSSQTAAQNKINDIKSSTADLTSQLGAIQAKTDPTSVASAAEVAELNKMLAESNAAWEATKTTGQTQLSDLQKTSDLSGSQAKADANQAALEKTKADNEAKLAALKSMVDAANQVTANQQASYAESEAARRNQQASSQLASQSLATQQALRGQADVSARQKYNMSTAQAGQALTSGAAGAAGAQAALAKTYGAPRTKSPETPSPTKAAFPLNKKSFYSGMPNPVGTFGLPASAAGITFGGS